MSDAAATAAANWEEEYAESFSKLADHGSATLKFFELFQVKEGMSPDGSWKLGLHWGKHHAAAFNLSDEELRSVKTYLRTQRSWLKKEKAAAPAVECRRRMWFLVQKLREVGAFDARTLRDICYWMDIAMDRTLEGCELRVESVGGQIAYATTGAAVGKTAVDLTAELAAAASPS